MSVTTTESVIPATDAFSNPTIPVNVVHIDDALVMKAAKDAFAAIEQGDKLHNSGRQHLSFAFYATHLNMVQDNAKLPALSTVLTSTKARETLMETVGAHLLGKRPSPGKGATADAMQQAKAWDARRTLTVECMLFCGGLAKHGVTLDAYNIKTRTWTVPLIAMWSPTCQVELPASRAKEHVTLTNGMLLGNGRNKANAEKRWDIRASFKQFKEANLPPRKAGAQTASDKVALKDVTHADLVKSVSRLRLLAAFNESFMATYTSDTPWSKVPEAERRILAPIMRRCQDMMAAMNKAKGDKPAKASAA